jgi:antitoxin (DNA-binding transcriptional repressor) of toxin-antitoxin stability system
MIRLGKILKPATNQNRKGVPVMTQVTIAEAQKRLPDLLVAVEAGEAVTIRSDQGRIFHLIIQTATPLVNSTWPGYPHAGSAKGLIQVADDFDEPLEELKEYME